MTWPWCAREARCAARTHLHKASLDVLYANADQALQQAACRSAPLPERCCKAKGADRRARGRRRKKWKKCFFWSLTLRAHSVYPIFCYNGVNNPHYYKLFIRLFHDEQNVLIRAALLWFKWLTPPGESGASRRHTSSQLWPACTRTSA